jgi:hypothetical protein
MKIELEDKDWINVQQCILRVVKLPEIDMPNMRYLMILHDKIETQKKVESPVEPVTG